MALAANDNRVIKIHEVTKVAPLANSTSTALTLPLTYFDILWFKLHPVERLFFYQITGLTSDLFSSGILPKLKHSLSLTLLHYLPLAGHVMWPEDAAKPAVYYFPDPTPEDGVSVTVAESNADFNHLSGNGFHEASEFHPLVPQLSISDDKAEVIAIQITLFPNQGFSIGISSHHAVLDGKSTTMFVKSWAYFCKQIQLGQEDNFSLPPELTPFFDRTVIKDPKGQDMVQLNKWFVNTGSGSNPNKRSLKVMPRPISVDVNKLVRATFELTREDIKKLRDKVNYETSEVKRRSNSKQLHLSTFVVTLAYVYACMVKAKTDEGDKNVIFGFTADYRSRLDPPVPRNYFGNCVGRCGEAAKASDFMQENGFAFAAEVLSDVVKEIDGDVFEVSDVKTAKMLEILKQGALLLTVAGSTRFDIYGTDFGWGRPKKVEIVSIDWTEAISLTESRDGGGGVEVGVVLEKQQMEVFASLFTRGMETNLV